MLLPPVKVLLAVKVLLPVKVMSVVGQGSGGKGGLVETKIGIEMVETFVGGWGGGVGWFSRKECANGKGGCAIWCP